MTATTTFSGSPSIWDGSSGGPRSLPSASPHAGYMHQDFYNNVWNEDVIALSLAGTMDFVAELEVVRNSPPRPYTVASDSDRLRLGRLLGLRRSEWPAIGDYSPVGYSLTHGDNRG